MPKNSSVVPDEFPASLLSQLSRHQACLYEGTAKGALGLDACEQPASPLSVRQSPCHANVLVLVVEAPIAPREVPALCERVRELLIGGDPKKLICDVSALVDPDIDTIGALARLHLTVRRAGSQVRLSHVPSELRDLLALTGLSEVLFLEISPRG